VAVAASEAAVAAAGVVTSTAPSVDRGLPGIYRLPDWSDSKPPTCLPQGRRQKGAPQAL